MDLLVVLLIALLVAAVVAATALWARAREARRRVANFEALREETLAAARAAVLATAQELSSKLLDDHKRETVAARDEAEARVDRTAERLLKQVEEVVKAVAALNGQVEERGRTVETLWRALSTPGGAGQMAEVGLANTLRSFGLEPGRDYLLQPSTEDPETGRRLRPDAIVLLPGSSVLVIDCKASKFLLDIAAAEGTPAEADAYRGLARSMNQHLRSLVEKDYAGAVLAAWRAAGRGDEIARMLTVMYLPNEGAIEKLSRADREFVQKARALGIIPAGPAGLHCAISLAAGEIGIMRQVENQQAIVEATRALLDGVGHALAHAAGVGRGLKSAAESFARLAGSVNGRLLPRARALGRLGLRPQKPLPGNLAAYVVRGLDGAELGEDDATDGAEPEATAPRLIVGGSVTSASRGD